MSEDTLMQAFQEIAAYMTRVLKEEEERGARAAVLFWLPRGLKWLVDYPKLLKLYVKLPHRYEVVGISYDLTKPAVYVVQRKRHR